MKPNCLRSVSLLILASVALTAQVARQETVVPLKNWATPLYWQPNQAEREVTARATPQTGGPQLVFSANQVSSNALTFIAITPCRLVDTRGGAFNGISPFSGPSIGAMTTATFPVQSATEASTNTAPAPCGTIPSTAQAYSLNLTVVPVAGGAVDYISMWPSGYSQPFVATLNDPQGAIVANAAIVPAGTVSGGISVYNQGPATANVIIDMNGFFAAPSDVNWNTTIGTGALAGNTTGSFNTGVGESALQDNSTGSENTATGTQALTSNTIGSANTATGFNALLYNNGSRNTASGVFALEDNTTGSNNTASGYAALGSNTTGSFNTATGFAALENNTTASGNTATGYQALQSNTTGGENTASGSYALQSNTTGNNNTANGVSALGNNTTGSNNTATGVSALAGNTSGGGNTAFGDYVLETNTTGSANTGIGDGALAYTTTGFGNTASGNSVMELNTTGFDNTANGFQTLQNNTTGFANTAIGVSALYTNTTGSSNIAVGYEAALNVVTGSNNIEIGSQGVSGDSGAIRLGTQGTQTSTFIAGISGATPGTPNLLVCVDANGQLGTTGCSTPSSRRFKEQISDMGDRSGKLFQLRPVTFLYKPQYDDGSHTLQYGLIAEEVATVYPDMVGYDKDGQPSSVKYQTLTPMLLNEVQKQNVQLQKQNAQLQSQAEQNRQQAEQIRALQADGAKVQSQSEQIRALEDRLAALETLLSSRTATAARPAGSQ